MQELLAGTISFRRGCIVDFYNALMVPSVQAVSLFVQVTCLSRCRVLDLYQQNNGSDADEPESRITQTAEPRSMAPQFPLNRTFWVSESLASITPLLLVDHLSTIFVIAMTTRIFTKGHIVQLY